jgi:hypothetical protein
VILSVFYFHHSIFFLHITSQLQTLLKRFTPYLAYPHLDSSLRVASPELITAPRHDSGSSFGSGSSSGDGRGSGGLFKSSNYGGYGVRRPPELITAPRHGSGSSFGGSGVVVSNSNFGGNGVVRKPLVLQPLMKSNS